MPSIRLVRASLSSRRAEAYWRRSWIRHFCPRDLTLRSRIPVMAKNWMKLRLRFFAFSRNPRGFMGFCATAAVEREDAIAAAWNLEARQSDGKQ